MDHLRSTQSGKKTTQVSSRSERSPSKKIFLGKLKTTGRGKRSVRFAEIPDTGKPILKRSLEKGTSQKAKTLFFKAAASGDLKKIKDCLAKGMDINATNSKGETALYIASSRRRTDVALFLLQQEGINVNQTNNNGRSPLHAAASSKNTDIARALLNHPSTDPNIQDKKELTPMHTAILRDAHGVISAIGDHPRFDADVRAGGESSLNFAESARNKKAADMLRPKTNPKDELNRTIPEMMAQRFSLHKFGFEDGYNYVETYKELGKNLYRFLSSPFYEGTYWYEVKDELVKYMEPLIDSWKDPISITPSTILDKIEKGNPLCIPAGTSGHFIDVSISGGENPVVAISNRGARVKLPEGKRIPAGITFLKLDDLREQFSEAFVKRLLARDESALRELYTKGTILYTHERVSQKRGNCAFAQAKAGAEAHFGFFQAEQAEVNLHEATPDEWKTILGYSDEIYQEFTLFDRVEGLIDYAQEFEDPNADVFQAAYTQTKNMAERRSDADGYYKIIDNPAPIMHMQQREAREGNLY